MNIDTLKYRSGWMFKSALAWHTTLGLCAGAALEFRPPETTAGLLIKINV